MSLRDELRTATVGSAAKLQRETVEWNGSTFEVRAPTLADSKYIHSNATDKKTQNVDQFKALCLGIVRCVYVPGEDTRVFENADMDSLMERGMSDFIGAFTDALGRLNKAPESMDAALEAAEKNS